MSASNSTWTLKVVILGQPSVGKTSLRRTYLGENFEESYLSTIGADFSYKKLTLPEGKVAAALWDLAGQLLHKNVNPQYFRGAAGAMVVYDVTNEVSFQSIPDWVEKYLLQSGNREGPILIIGNKIDLLKTPEAIEESEQKQEKLVAELREKHQSVSSFLSSRTAAKTGDNVEAAFTDLVLAIIDWQLMKPLEKRVPTSLDEMPRMLPTAYIIAINEIFGPKIISKIQTVETDQFSNQELSSTIKITSVLDIDIINQSYQLTGSVPWSEPNGNFYYIAFYDSSNSTKTERIIFLIGFIGLREISEMVAANRNLVDGYLHQAMNEFNQEKSNLKMDLHSSEMPTKLVDKNPDIADILLNLRKNVFEVIRKSNL